MNPFVVWPDARASVTRWFTGRRLVGGLLVVMGAALAVAVALGWYPAP